MSPSRGGRLLAMHVCRHYQTRLPNNHLVKHVKRTITSSFFCGHLHSSLQSFISSTPSSFSHDYSQNLSNQNIQFGSRSIHAPRQEAYGHPEWQSHTIDYSLFEEEDVKYSAHLNRSKKAKVFSTRDPMLVLQTLISKREFQQANSVLQELKALGYPINLDGSFVSAALEFATIGDWKSSLEWLHLVPKRDSRTAASPTRFDILSKILEMATSPGADPEAALKILLFLTRFGYLSSPKIANIAKYTMKLYVKKGKPGASYAEQATRSEWSLDLWIELIRLDAIYHAHLNRSRRHMRDMQLYPNIGFFAKTFNSCIRALCRSGQVEEILPWIKIGYRSRKPEESVPRYYWNVQRAAKISPPTWKMILDRVETLPKRSQEILTEEIVSIIRPSPNNKGSLRPRSLRPLKEKNQRLLNSIDLEAEQNVPRLTEISVLTDSLTKDLKEDKFMRGLQRYFRNVYDPHLANLARSSLGQHEFNFLDTDYNDAKFKLLSDQRTSFLALNLIAEMARLRNGIDRRSSLSSLYETWIASIAHLQTQVEPSRASSKVLNEVSWLMKSASETPLPTSLTTSMQPNASHFALFMRLLVRAFSYPIPDQASASNTILAPEHEKAVQWAVRIMADMQRFGQKPDRGPWQILIESLARGMKHSPDIKESGLNSINGVLKTLGIGETDAARSTEEKFVTPFTYASFIRALLSIPHIRGGPLVEEAEVVKRWFTDDSYSQKQLHDENEKYSKSVEEAFTLLQSCKEEKLLQRNVG